MSHNTGIFQNKNQQVSWKSQENKFCKYCKCWVADNPVSQNFHEQGARHKKALADSLTEMKRKSIKDAKTEDKRVDAIRQMEEAALQDYRDKDVHSSRDFTAKLYNGEKLPDTEGIVVKQGPQQNPYANEPEEVVRKVKKDPMAEVTGDAPDKWDKDYMQKMEATKKAVGMVKGKTVFKPKEGTPKLWYEAKDDDGNIFYYHIKTSESRWDAPPWGYLSIKEQEEIETQQRMKEYSKEKIIYEQREVHGEKRKAEIIHRAMPDMSSKDPYGRGGWAQVASEEEQRAQKEETIPDLGLPAKREKIQPVIEAEEEKLEIKEKTLPAGQLAADRYGLVPLPGQVEKVEKVVAATQPKISFRKRKNQSFRERDDDD